jgi:hypothetical protein
MCGAIYRFTAWCLAAAATLSINKGMVNGFTLTVHSYLGDERFMRLFTKAWD